MTEHLKSNPTAEWVKTFNLAMIGFFKAKVETLPTFYIVSKQFAAIFTKKPGNGRTKVEGKLVFINAKDNALQGL